MAGEARKGGKKNRKFGRNRGRITKMGATGGSSTKYANRKRREKNKAARIARHEAKTKRLSCGHASRYKRDNVWGCQSCRRESNEAQERAANEAIENARLDAIVSPVSLDGVKGGE